MAGRGCKGNLTIASIEQKTNRTQKKTTGMNCKFVPVLCFLFKVQSPQQISVGFINNTTLKLLKIYLCGPL